WPRDGAELAINGVHHFAAHACGTLLGGDRGRVLDDRERDGNLSFDRIGYADHRDLRDTRMRLHRFLDLTRAQPMTRDVDDVVGPPKHEIISVAVSRRPVERRVRHPVWKGRKISV